MRTTPVQGRCPDALSDTLQYFLQRLHRDLGPGFVSMSTARIIRIARLVPFDELKRRNLSELLRLPSFLMLVKQCEDPSANILLSILQSKFGSAESEVCPVRRDTKTYVRRIMNVSRISKTQLNSRTISPS